MATNRLDPGVREGYAIVAREVEVHDTGLHDDKGRAIHYETTIEAIADPERPDTPRSWRVTGQQLRDGVKSGKGTSPVHLYSINEARTMTRTLFHKHRRWVEKFAATRELRRLAAEEDMEKLCTRY